MALFLAGCAPAAARTAPPTDASAPPLCQAAARLDRLVVVRRLSLARPGVRFSLPGLVVVRRPSAVRAVAVSLCGLPAVPTGVFSCPADFGVTYGLSFFDSRRAYPEVRLQAGGCESVSGLGATRSVARSPAFWRTLGAAMGAPGADESTFAGSP